MRASLRLDLLVLIAAAALPLASSLAVHQLHAQTPAARLIAQARAQLDLLNADSAAALLRRALEPGSEASVPERVRGFVLLGVTELVFGREFGARQAFREALRLDRELRVDSLASLHSSLLTVFGGERALLPPAPAVAPALLELRDVPLGARVLVNGEEWLVRRQQVTPGLHRIEVRARGYVPLRDSAVVDSGRTVVRRVVMTPVQHRGALRFAVMPTLHFILSRDARDALSSALDSGGLVLEGMTTFGAAGRLGYHVGTRLAFALTVEGAGLPGTLNSVLSGNVSVLYSLTRSVTAVPYAVVGTHVTRYRGFTGSVTTTPASPSGHVGLGLNVLLRGRLTLQLESRLMAARVSRGATMLTSLSSVGVSY